MARSSKSPRNHPKIKNRPSDDPEVRRSVEPENAVRRKISWQLGVFDWEGPWGECTLKDCNVISLIAEQIGPFESMAWSELPKKQHHAISCEKLNKIAQRRLIDIQQDDVDEIFSLRLQGQHRVYGIRDGSILKVIWYDRDHGDNENCVCRSNKKNT
jgi:hypothetical protein